MSVLPPEILDYILDFLHDERETLKQCCLVSKSWVPRTRKYLFADIVFNSARTLESWNNTFPDPTNSPASHVGALTIDCDPEDGEGADWIRTFFCVAQPRLSIPPPALFPNLKSLYVQYKSFSCPELFDFICSFPLLEDLVLIGVEGLEDIGDDFHGLQTSPLFTGTLTLSVFEGMGSFPRHLLSLPNGLRFRELVLLLDLEEDYRWVSELVSKCSDTLECLDVKFKWPGSGTFFWLFCSGDLVDHLLFTGSLNPIDLSKATKLKELIFRMRPKLGPGEVVATLETLTPDHRDFRQVSIYLNIPHLDALYFRFYLADGAYEKWSELDCLLVQFWELRSIRATVAPQGTQADNDWIECLFPKITARGIIDLAEEH
jgi:hypothetical protein